MASWIRDYLDNDSDMNEELSNLSMPIRPSQLPCMDGPDLTLEEEDRILGFEDEDIPPTSPSTSTNQPPTIVNHQSTPTPPNPRQHLYPNVVVANTITHPPTSAHTTAPPTHTTTPTSVTTTPVMPTTTTSDSPQQAFGELLALYKTKSSHQHHIHILSHHLSNHTTPTNLQIKVQPWVQLSPQHQKLWDTGIQECTTIFNNTLIAHHTEQMEKVNQQIQLVSSALHQQSPQVASTLIHVASASTHKTPKRTHPTTSKPSTTIQPKPPTKKSKRPQKTTTHAPSTIPSTTITPSSPHNYSHFRKRPHVPPQPQRTRPPLRIPPPPHHQPSPSHHNPSPSHHNPLLHQLGDLKRFPIIHHMFTKGRQ